MCGTSRLLLVSPAAKALTPASSVHRAREIIRFMGSVRIIDTVVNGRNRKSYFDTLLKLLFRCDPNTLWVSGNSLPNYFALIVRFKN
jgi:hypothetical protein